MNNEKIKKLDSKERLEELSPVNTLTRAGFKGNMQLCDIGAGTGIFSLPASEISDKEIYALEISDRMIEILRKRAHERNVENLIVKKVESEVLPLDNYSCDMVLMVTVLHEIDNKEFMINEIRRILKESGRFVLIEFYKRKTLMGPPVNHRISEEELVKLCTSNGLKLVDRFSLGSNLYSVVFELKT